MCQVFFDTLGRLLEFECVPPEFEGDAGPAPAANWAPVFAAAGFDMNAFHAAAPQWTELVEADTRAAWTGTWPGHPDIPVRVEAGAFRGTPVYFETISAWDKPERMQPEKPKTSDVISYGVLLALFFAILAFAILLANRNLRAKRGDNRGAFRLAVAVLIMMWVSGALFAHHVPTIH